mmetsp:Transcript_23765/g.36070  ORF Transcript_23765/g.36070 Transcript_23765/m.36070 type:complete len:171 (+) Transcript_23765:679-1191(+)
MLLSKLLVCKHETTHFCCTRHDIQLFLGKISFLQIISILVHAFFADYSIRDLIMSFNFFFHNIEPCDVETKEVDSYALSERELGLIGRKKFGKLFLSVLLCLVQGMSGCGCRNLLPDIYFPHCKGCYVQLLSPNGTSLPSISFGAAKFNTFMHSIIVFVFQLSLGLSLVL